MFENRDIAIMLSGLTHMNKFVPLLVLDLDETLIYGAEREGTRPCDFRVGRFHVFKRPHLDDFLCGAGELFRLAVWSSASADYVDAIARTIIPPGLEWAFVWSRDRCVIRRNPETFETEYVKDLKKVKRQGYDLARILVVDDTGHKVARNFGNAIYITSFDGDPDDKELPILLQYIGSIAGAENFRVIEKRGWRARIAGSNGN
jgi:TFIIF-interacting CTD phosphatase-like protein